MKLATESVLHELDEAAEQLKKKILESPDALDISGKKYYVSADGNDQNSGDINHPWQSLEKASSATLKENDAVLFKRGDLFRGQLVCQSGVTYGAYGEGPKPKIYTGEKDYADASLWTCVDEKNHIYRLNEKIMDLGNIVFNDGEAWGYKHIPSCIGGEFFCREDSTKPFIVSDELQHDLDFFCDCRAVMTTQMSHDETWPVPDSRDRANKGDLYLRSDLGNPGSRFRTIEVLMGFHTINVAQANHVHIDNLCLKYCGAHAISAYGPCIEGLHVTNCEIGWIGGMIQHYLGTDPNYPEGTRGSVTRFGNGIEIYGGCKDYYCARNYVYQVYDAGVTHQFTNDGGDCMMTNVRYTENLIEKCVYSIEYFLSNTDNTKSLMDGLEIDHNILRFAGYGWGQQRHNAWTPANIKSWTFENPGKDYFIHDNIFDRSKFRLLHLCCKTEKDYPVVDHNTYVQTFGRSLGQFGAYEKEVPPVLSFFETSDKDIREKVKDQNATVYYIKQD